MAFQLRPYQTAGVDAVRTLLRSGRRRVLLVAPTGAGKTVIATHIIECSVDLGNRVLFLAHRRELITQAFKKLIGCSCRPGYDHDSFLPDPECRADGLPRKSVGVLMANDRRRNPGAAVQVASIDTLRNRALPPANLVLVDEAHRSLATTYRGIAAGYPNAAMIGLTATPYRADRRGLGEAYDEMVVVASPAELIDQGALVEPRVFTVPASSLPDLSAVRIKGNDYDASQLSAAVDRRELVGDIVAHWQAKASDLLTVVFAASIEHSKHIVERFRAAGVPAEHLDGMTETTERDAILARLERGETRVVSNMGVLVEGWDQPSVKCCILARPTKSTGAYLQMAGRILRPYLGLNAIILDHAGCVLEHGLPQADREFTLDAAPKRKASTAPPCKTCLSCFAIIPASLSMCPECGHGFVVEDRGAPSEVEGELVEVREATMEEKRARWDELCADAVARGYAPGWAKHKYKKQFGVWPPSTFAFPDRPKPHASDAVKREHLEALRAQCVERGYRVTWIEHRYRSKWGEEVPAEWLAPQLAAGGARNPAPAALPVAVGDDVVASLEEWSL